jgi:iron(III) transport system substrate-binding protein
MSIVSRRRWILAGLCAVVLAAGPAAAQAPMGNIGGEAHPLHHVTAGAGCRAGRSPHSSGATGAVEVDVFRSGTTEVMGKLAAEFAAGAPKADVLLLADARDHGGAEEGRAAVPYREAKVEASIRAPTTPDRTYFGSKLITTGIAVNTAAKSAAHIVGRPSRSPSTRAGRHAEPLYSGAAAIMLGTMTSRPDLGWSYFEKLKAADAVAVRGNGAS